jgi:hypothetical protein
MAKPKAAPTLIKDPIKKKTKQGDGRRSKPSHGRKKSRGQGR